MSDFVPNPKKAELMDFLLQCDGGDPEAEHSRAEKLLVEWLRSEDLPLAEAWEEARENWWYA